MSEAASLGDLLANLPLFRDAILCALVSGVLLGFLGVYVVLRRMVFASAAISQGAALGVALAFLFEILLGAEPAPDGALTFATVVFSPVAWAVICALGVTLVLVADPQRLRLTRESLLGLVFLLTNAGAVIVGDKISQEAHDINAILFGSGVAVREADLVAVAIAAVVILAQQAWLLRATVYTSFDPAGAQVAGLPVRRLNVTLFVSIGVAVALTTRALGALPVFGFSVLPAMAALALTSHLWTVFLLSAFIGGASGLVGYAIAFVLQLPVGATQTATMVAVLLLVLAGRAIVGRRMR